LLQPSTTENVVDTDGGSSTKYTQSPAGRFTPTTAPTPASSARTRASDARNGPVAVPYERTLGNGWATAADRGEVRETP
jgi:hypothetical protein